MGRVFKPRRKRADGGIWVSPKWYVEFRYASGVQHRLPASTSKNEARGLLKELEGLERRRSLGLEPPRQKKTKRTLTGLVEEYLRDVEVRLHPSTYESYKDSLSLTLLGRDRGGKKVGPTMCLEDLNLRWAAKFQREALPYSAPRTINKKLRTVYQMLNWAVRVGYLSTNPLQHLSTLPKRPGATTSSQGTTSSCDLWLQRSSKAS